MEHSGVLDERLRDRVPGAVGGAIVLVLRVRRVVVRERGRVLLRALAAGLRLAVALRGLRELLRRLVACWRKAGSAMGLLRCTWEALDIIMTEDVPVSKSSGISVGVVEVL